MSREDIHEVYEHGDIETVELGLDHDGKKQWYYSTRDGWEEIGKDDCLMLSSKHYAVGTKIELHNPIKV